MINRDWHEKNKMPKNPKLEDKIKWHIEHHKNCTCRQIPNNIKAEIEKLKTK